jgi:hypothetical protein
MDPLVAQDDEGVLRALGYKQVRWAMLSPSRQLRLTVLNRSLMALTHHCCSATLSVACSSV